MKRLAVALLSLGLFAAPLAAKAQPAGKIYRIGFLSAGLPSPPSPLDPDGEAFRQGLRQLGYVEGQNILIERRWAKGVAERLPDLAAELVRLNPDMILVVGTQATTAIPILMVYVGDPVGTGIVASLARPGGNITGLSATAWEWTAKMLELVRGSTEHGAMQGTITATRGSQYRPLHAPRFGSEGWYVPPRRWSRPARD